MKDTDSRKLHFVPSRTITGLLLPTRTTPTMPGSSISTMAMSTMTI